MSSIACADTDDIQFIAKTNAAKRVLTRLNNVSSRLCDIEKRSITAEFRLRQYCIYDASPSDSSSSSSSECFPQCCDTEEVEELYELDEEQATDVALLSLLDDLEGDACELFRELKSLEAVVGTDCNIPESSSSSDSSESSSDSSSESSSDSSSESSSSSSTSSSSSQTCCKEVISLYSECEALGLDPPLILFGRVSAIPGGGPCEYVEEDVLNSSSSSSSGSSSSSSDSTSDSSSGYTGISVVYEAATNTFKIFNNGVLVTSLPDMNECEPYGSYLIETGECAGSYIIVE